MNTETPPLDPPGLLEDADAALSHVLPEGRISREGIAAVHAELSINHILPGLKLDEPTALLLDNNNLFLRARDNGFAIDYRRLKRILDQRCMLRHAVAFTALDKEDAEALGWASWMEKLGYEIESRDLVRYTGRDNKEVAKGNMDVDLAVHAMDLSEAFTHVIIGTCDGDFIRLVKRLREDKFRRVSILGISGRNFSGMSRELIKAADNFYDLTKLQEHVRYQGERYD